MRLIGSGCKRSNVCSWRILIDRRLNQIFKIGFWAVKSAYYLVLNVQYILITMRRAIVYQLSQASILSGDDSKEVTPVPMPNTEVKLFSADGSWTYVPRE